MKNFVTIRCKKFTFLSSPLALLVLGACGGGGSISTGPYGGSFVGSSSSTVGGNVVKGPLSNALVGLDYDGDGVVDSATVRTGVDGSYSLTTTNTTYTVIAVADETTIDTSSGTVLSGITLKAPAGTSVVTPTTTLIEEAGITKEQVAEVLGLPDGVDPLSFNPYADGVDAADALAVEKASQQIMSVVNAFAGAAEGSGATEAEAFEAALNSVVEVVKTKATKLSDASASAADKTLDLTNASDLALVKAEVAAKVAAETSADTTAFDALADDTVTAVKNVNDKIATVDDLSSAEAKNTFSTTQVLADQVKAAAEAEVASAGSGSIDFTDATKVETAAANKAPTDIALSKTAIAEDASSLVIGTLTTTDSDQTSGVIHTYKIAELSGTDYAAFSINAATGELSFKAQPDFETKSNYSITILSTDEGGKTFSKSFTISVTNANDAPTVANAISDQTIAEDSALSFQFASDVFSDVDAGDSLTYAATLADGSTLPSWLSFDASSRTFSGTPSNGDVGAIDVKVTATDGSSAPATDTFTLTVTNTNDAPTVANAISDQTIAEDSALSFQFASDVFSDVDAGDSLTYAATLADGSTLPSWLSFDASSRTFSGTPSNGDVGAIDVKVTATDGSSAPATDTFTLTVTNTNVNKVPTPSNFNAKTLQNIYDGVDSFSLNADSERIYTLNSDSPDVSVAVSVERLSGTVEGLFAVAKHTHNNSEVSIGVLSHHELFRAALGRDPSIDDSARLVANFINEVAPANQLLNSDQPLRILSIGSNPYFSTRQTDGERYTYIDAVDSNEIEGRIHSEFNYEIDTLRAEDRHLVVEDILGPQRDWATDYDVVILRPSYEREYIDMALDWAASTGGSLLFGFDAGSFPNNPSYVAPHPEFLDFLENDLGIAIGEPRGLESDTNGLDDYSVTRINPFTTVNLRNYLGLTDGVPGTDASQPLQVTSEMNLVSVVTDQNGLKVGDVSWSSSNEAIVSNSGELNAAGNATLAATINGVDGNTYVVNTYIEAFPLLDENGNSLTQGLTFDIVGWDDDVSTNYSDNKIREFNRVDQTYIGKNNIFNLTEIENSGDLLYSFVSADLWIDDTGSFLTGKTSKTPSYSNNVKDEINTELGVSDQPIVAVVSGFIIANETGTHSIKLSSLDKQSELWIQTEGGVVNKYVDNGSRDINIELKAGEHYKVVALYRDQNNNKDWFELTWREPSSSEYSAIPASNLIARPPRGYLSVGTPAGNFF